ncbi:F-box/kelch-repeat protein [Panicum miliaceum]|uniref:F-box/kelch-repeat protein n=1 Tax=Panicum miliaceum TaxID=4540 RepID=A0A3L6Q6J6_PANMI|nr:F-box/kelch-repeat protein [Panicum miliaceum]
MAGYAADHGKEFVSDEAYRYDACLNRWTALAKMNVARRDFACAEVNAKFANQFDFDDFLDSAKRLQVFFSLNRAILQMSTDIGHTVIVMLFSLKKLKKYLF